MAQKLVFFIGDSEQIYNSKLIEFKYYNGFSITQKHKSIESLHNAINEELDVNILEVSSKSNSILGIKLSAFNLKFTIDGRDIPLENIFQSSKVFENGGPYYDLLYVSPREAKKDLRLKNSGKLIGFKFKNKTFPLEPQTLYYDWLYCRCLSQYKDLVDELTKYSCFTDIEFNHTKSINCQARSLAIFSTLKKLNKLDYALECIENFSKIVYGV